MSTKVWGICKDTERLINIRDLNKDTNTEVVCTSCGCTLISNMGDKKDWYFRHKTTSNCTGGSAEGLLHRLCKEVFEELDSIYMPDEYIIFKGKPISIKDSHLVPVFGYVQEKSLTDGIRPDIWWRYNGVYYCLEVVVTHNIASSTLSKYKEFAKENNCVVCTLNVSSLADKVDSLDKHAIKNLLYGELYKEIVVSSDLVKYETALKTGIYRAFSGDIICPVNSSRINTRKCHSCCFYDSTRNGIQTCYGKQCFATYKDILRDESVEDRLDRYDTCVPSVVAPQNDIGIVFDDDKRVEHPIGVCGSCGGVLQLRRGVDNIFIGGIPSTGWSSDKYIYRVCTKCGRKEELSCKCCGSPLGAWINTNKRYKSCGSVFIGCTNRDQLGGTCQSDTLTLYVGENCNEYADEIKAIGSLDFYLSQNKRVLNKLKKVRGVE